MNLLRSIKGFLNPDCGLKTGLLPTVILYCTYHIQKTTRKNTETNVRHDVRLTYETIFDSLNFLSHKKFHKSTTAGLTADRYL